MEGSVLSFLKAEWKVSDTGSAHWASSSHLQDFLNLNFIKPHLETSFLQIHQNYLILQGKSTVSKFNFISWLLKFYN